MSATVTHRDRQQLDRLVFFSDAIFAIAITLLVIEIKVPHFPNGATDEQLGNALAENISSYIGFIVSFFVIGRFWLGHHRSFGYLARADERLVWRNLLFLLTIAFMPYPTAVISNFASSRVGVGFYAVWLGVSGVMNLLVMRTLIASPDLDPAVDASERRVWLRRAWSPIVVAVLAFAAAMVSPLLAMIPLLASPVIVRLFSWTRKPALPAA